MAVDPSDPDTFEDEADFPEDAEIDVEAPESDTAEQHTDLTPNRDAPVTGEDTDHATEADLAEQARAVGFDEDDDYR
ncbi:hypothetical protein OK074_6043 [Actinobacteria bacterium OK074]|nr:hypothetical protein OK074_6043 [Actinobacteria bacterium OK074]